MIMDRFISMRYSLTQLLIGINLGDIKNNLQKITEDIWVEYSGDIIYSKDLDIYAQGYSLGGGDEVKELRDLVLGKKVLILLNSKFDSEDLGAVMIGEVTEVIKEPCFVTEIYLNNEKFYNTCKKDFSRCYSSINRRLYLNGHLLGIIELRDDEYQNLSEKFKLDPKNFVNNRITYYNETLHKLKDSIYSN
jgi:hypothetical protein